MASRRPVGKKKSGKATVRKKTAAAGRSKRSVAKKNRKRPGARAGISSVIIQQPEDDLAPFAMRAVETRGRQYEEPEHAFRTSFQRDRDRIIHSRAFRRLEYKTQVFVNHEGDHFRTRLTHSIEVSQVGRTVAKALGLNRDLVEALALSHDLGHTPFGHLGEQVLHVLMVDHGGYNHNRQSLRIVEKLEDRYPAWPGLNLTYELREGIAKHSGPIVVKVAPEFARYRPTEAPPLEAQMIDIVDEIGYNHHDVDDGISSELLPADQLARDIPIFGEHWRRGGKKFPRASQRQKVAMALTGMIDTLVTDLIATSIKRIRASGVESVDDVRKNKQWLIGLSPAAAARNAALKRYLHKNLYRHHQIERMKDKSRRMLEALFHRYMENTKLMPESFQARIKKDGRERVICDYIAGMTDRYAVDEYRRLFDPEIMP
jgi:dGTPase